MPQNKESLDNFVPIEDKRKTLKKWSSSKLNSLKLHNIAIPGTENKSDNSKSIQKSQNQSFINSQQKLLKNEIKTAKQEQEIMECMKSLSKSCFDMS